MNGLSENEKDYYNGVNAKVALNIIADFFLPRFCAGCFKKFESAEHHICGKCLAAIHRVSPQIIKDNFASNFSHGFIKEIIPIFLFEKEGALQNIIHAVKYNQNISLARFIGRKMGSILKSERADLKIDLIIPVPLHILKKSERGFNQSAHISKGISQILKIEVNSKLRRVRYTESQTKMDKAERKQNIASAFKTKFDFSGKNILLVDDVITTGATISECARILKTAGAANIYACSVAIA